MQRDELWLQQLLDDTWDKYFSDVPQNNTVKIVFGKRAKRQLGSIRMDRRDQSVSIITMNGLFRDPEIPEFIALATLVHELTHYAHGFSSPLEQKHSHPHAGGVIRAEYRERGLEDLYLKQRAWLKENWPAVIKKHFPPKIARAPKGSVPKPFWFV